MASKQAWLEVLAWTKALFEGTKAPLNLLAAFEHNLKEPNLDREAGRASKDFFFYSEEQVESMHRRLTGCRDRADTQGREELGACLCGVMNEAIAGNGGELPDFEGWREMYAHLKCSHP